MEKLQNLHNKISSKLVDLRVEKRRLKSLTEQLKKKYQVTPENIEAKFVELQTKRKKCKEELIEETEKLEKKLEKYEDL